MKGLAFAGFALAIGVATALAYPDLWLAGPDLTGSTHRVPGLDGPVQVLRDSAGFPLIRAETHRDALTGLGFVMAADRAHQIQMRQEAAGRRPVRRPAALAPQLAEAFEAFARGGNAFPEASSPRPSPEHRLLRKRARAWQVEDPLAILSGLIAAPLPEAAPCPAGSWMGCIGPGSFAVTTRRSATGAPLLSAHLTGRADELPSFWYAAQLVTPEARIQGLFLPGVPMAITGRDAVGAWMTESWHASETADVDVAAWATAMLSFEAATSAAQRARAFEAFAGSGLGTSIVTADALGARGLLSAPDLSRIRIRSAARTGILTAGRGPQAERLGRALDAQGSIGLDGLDAIARDSSHGGIPEIWPMLTRAFPATASDGDDPRSARIRDVLAAWDGRCDRGSRGCALFAPIHARWKNASGHPLAGDDGDAELRSIALEVGDELEEIAGPEPDGWNWGSLQRLEMRAPGSEIPILGRWFRRGPFAFEGCDSCAATAWTPDSGTLRRFVQIAGHARFQADLARPESIEIALPGAADENPFRQSGQPLTDAWLAGRLHTLSVESGSEWTRLVPPTP